MNHVENLRVTARQLRGCQFGYYTNRDAAVVDDAADALENLQVKGQNLLACIEEYDVRCAVLYGIDRECDCGLHDLRDAAADFRAAMEKSNG